MIKAFVACGEPVDDVAAITTHIEAEYRTARGAAYLRRVPEIQMQAAGTCSICASSWEAMLVLKPPGPCRVVLYVDVEHGNS